MRVAVLIPDFLVVSASTASELPLSQTPPEYSDVTQAFFESEFGVSFTNGKHNPLLVGAPNATGSRPLSKIEITQSGIVLHNAGKILVTYLEKSEKLSQAAVNGVDFVSLDPDLVGLDWSLSTEGYFVRASVVTPQANVFEMQGAYITLTVTVPEWSYTDSATIFIPSQVQSKAGNIVFRSGGPLDIPAIVECGDLPPEDCEEFRQCFFDYETCYQNAQTTYQQAVSECDSIWETIKNAGAGACGGAAGGAVIGSCVPGVGTLLGGAVGFVGGIIAGGLIGYYDCLDDARDQLETDNLLCVNELEGCINAWLAGQ